MMRYRNLLRQIEKNRKFLFLFVAILIAKITLLLTAQCYTDGDESVVGVMAIHILRNGEYPIYFWGQPYGGGGAIEAYLGAALFSIFGISGIALKSVALFFSLATVLFCYASVKCLRGERAALWSVSILSFSSTYVEWFTKVRGGYVESPFFMMLLLWLIINLKTARDKSGIVLFLIGLVSGFAYYVQELILPYLLFILLFVIFRQLQTTSKLLLTLLVIGLIIGLTPCLIYNFANHFENFRRVFGAPDSVPVPKPNFLHEFLDNFPALFQPRNFDAVPADLNWRVYTEALLYLLLASVTVFSAAIAFIRRKKQDLDLEVLLGGALISWVFIAFLHPQAISLPRYFLLYFPIFAIFAGIAASTSSDESFSVEGANVAFPSLVKIAAVFLLLSGVWSHLTFLGAPYVVDRVLLPNGDLTDKIVDARAIPQLIAILRSKNIRTVRSPYFSQWRILFESKEEVIASSKGMVPSGNRFSNYDDEVRHARRNAYLLHCDSNRNLDLVKRSNLSKIQIMDYCLYIPGDTQEAGAV